MLCRLALALVCGLALPAPSLADDNSPVACTCDPTPVPVAPRVPRRTGSSSPDTAPGNRRTETASFTREYPLRRPPGSCTCTRRQRPVRRSIRTSAATGCWRSSCRAGSRFHDRRRLPRWRRRLERPDSGGTAATAARFSAAGAPARRTLPASASEPGPSSGIIQLDRDSQGLAARARSAAVHQRGLLATATYNGCLSISTTVEGAVETERLVSELGAVSFQSRVES